MDAEAAQGSSRIGGLVTLATGAVLVLSPERGGRLVGIDRPRTARLVGAGDLLLVPGLLTGRPRWPWMAARAVLNLPTAAVFLSARQRSARAVGVSLLLLTVGDARTATTLYRAGR
jgi:hypothetical protein